MTAELGAFKKRQLKNGEVVVVDKTTILANSRTKKLTVAVEGVEWMGSANFVLGGDGILYRGQGTNKRRLRDGENLIVSQGHSITIIDGSPNGYDIHTDKAPDVFKSSSGKNTSQFGGVVLQASNNRK